MSPVEIQGLRYVVASIWLVTGALSFGLYPVEDSLLLLQNLHVPRNWAVLVLYSGALLDVTMGLLTLARPGTRLWFCQIMLIAGYTVLATLLVPQYWLHPFGPLLKNFAVLALLCLLYRHDRKGVRGS